MRTIEPSRPSGPDPILAAIERHRGLWAELGRQCRATRDMSVGDQIAALELVDPEALADALARIAA
jgi:hypothetical protein